MPYRLSLSATVLLTIPLPSFAASWRHMNFTRLQPLLIRASIPSQPRSAAENFALSVFGKMVKSVAFCQPINPVEVDGDPNAAYYQPRDRHGDSIDIRKVKPVTTKACTQCGFCAEVCPMGAIDKNDCTRTPGICIKCCACIKKCPQGAKLFTDTGFLYHKEELEAMYGGRRTENSFYL